jgi:hypothetical protein
MPGAVIIDSSQQHFATRLTDSCTSKLQELHRDPSSGAQIDRVVKEEH